MTAPVRTSRAPSFFPNEAGASPGASSEPRRPAEVLSSLLRAWRRDRVAWAGAAGTREATWRGRRVWRPRTRRAGRRRGCPAGGQIGRRRLTNETGWTGRTLRRDGSGPDRMAGPRQRRRRPRVMIWSTSMDCRAEQVGGCSIRSARRSVSRSVMAQSPPATDAGDSWVSAATRSLASARELVLFTVPRVMPRSRATVASGKSNK
jgi:hypothetical protein